MNLPGPRRPRPSGPLPSPRKPHSADKTENIQQSEVPPRTTAALGETAMRDPEQIHHRVRRTMNNVEAAAQAWQEAVDDTSTQVEFESKTGAELRKKPKGMSAEQFKEIDEANDALGIDGRTEAVLVFNFSDDNDTPRSMTLQLTRADSEDYRLIDVIAMPPEAEGGKEEYFGSMQLIRDESTMTNPTEINEKAVTDLEQGNLGGVAKQLSGASGTRSLIDSELKATAIISQRLLDLQPPLPGQSQ